MNFQTPIENIKFIREKQIANFKKLKIRTLGDLLFYFPEQYEDFSDVKEIKELRINESSVIKGKAIDINEEKSLKKRMSVLTILLSDSSASVEVVFFNQGFLKQSIKKGEELILAGKLRFKGRSLYFSPPYLKKLIKVNLLIWDK